MRGNHNENKEKLQKLYNACLPTQPIHHIRGMVELLDRPRGSLGEGQARDPVCARHDHGSGRAQPVQPGIVISDVNRGLVRRLPLFCHGGVGGVYICPRHRNVCISIMYYIFFL